MAGEVSREALTRSWTHSHEEDQPALKVFRPSGSGFPPSRGRDTIDLKPTGELGGMGPGPTDASTPRGGTWSLAGRALTITNAGRSGVTYEIESLDHDRLVLRTTEST